MIDIGLRHAVNIIGRCTEKPIPNTEKYWIPTVEYRKLGSIDFCRSVEFIHYRIVVMKKCNRLINHEDIMTTYRITCNVGLDVKS